VKKTGKQKILAVVAHPDDEILGVGGTLLKHKKSGDETYVCIVTKAHEPQWSKEYMSEKIAEQKKVDTLLGVTKRFNLEFPTARLNAVYHGDINKKVSEVFDEVNPDIVYTHFEDDIHRDHYYVYKACLVASRPPRHVKLICCETLSETEWNTGAFKPNYWVDIKDFLDKKIQAFKIYKSEMKKYPHPRSPEGIRILANKRGTEICTEYAEAFMIMKEYWE